MPKALRAITHVCKDFAEHEQKTLHSEAERYKVPTVASNSFEDVMRDHDIRNVVRSLAGDERTAVLNRLKDGDDPQLLLAVLRDPLLWRRPEVHELATSAWRDLRDRNDPMGRAELDLKLATIAWAKRSIGHVAGTMRLILSIDRNEPFDRGQVFELLRDEQSAAGKVSAAADLFGYSQREAANLELHIKRRAAA